MNFQNMKLNFLGPFGNSLSYHHLLLHMLVQTGTPHVETDGTSIGIGPVVSVCFGLAGEVVEWQHHCRRT